MRRASLDVISQLRFPRVVLGEFAAGQPSRQGLTVYEFVGEFTPTMTLDHAILTAVWTLYLAVGSYLKDERLAHYMGEEYRQYQQQVPGYPLAPWGPLGRRR